MSSRQKSSSPSPVPGFDEQNRDDASIPSKDSSSEIQPEHRAPSVPTECTVEVADDLEKGPPQEDERECRICQLSLDAANQDGMGGPIELGCACKDDLAAAHRQCAEAWFRIKGNSTCEICGSVAHNVSLAHDSAPGPVDRWENEEIDPTAVITIPVVAVQPRQSRNFWPGHRFLNFLLACMVFAFIISWLFHFNFPS